MGKKRKGYPSVEEVLARPWCYYCERDFDDLKILISHQKAKHFKCERCGRRLNTAGGLSVHMNQVHKEQLSSVENALPNRQGLEVEIFGMEGIPEDITQTHNQRVLQQYYEAQAQRRAKSGNLNPGEPSKRKKIKLESPEELKNRLAEWKVKKLTDPTGVGGVGTPGKEVNSPSTLVNSPATLAHPSTITQPHSLPAPPQPNVPFPQPGYQQPFPAQPPGAPGFPPDGPAFAGMPGYPPGMPPQFSAGPIPQPSGLPQRPTFNAPSLNSQQMQKIHQGQLPGLQGAANGHLEANTAAAIDELIASASKGAGKSVEAPEKERKGKKDKDKNSRMAYSDNDFSPEEKMAMLPRYAFVRG